VYGISPPTLNNSIKSWNYPCISPQTYNYHFTVTGAGIFKTFGSN
jgi:hypothetical protein